MKTAVIVNNLAKQYRIGEWYGELVLFKSLVRFLKHPLTRKPKETIWALRDISFSVQEGEVLGIIGRNGAGKSTLLKLLAKITCPTSGSLNVSGRIASLLEVGTGFHEELTGRENIYLNGSILGMTKKETNRKLDEIIAFSGVERFIETPIKRYSSGMRLRLGFAVAAHLDTDVLLIDEILAVGDGEFQKKCLNTMDNLSAGGRTVLFVSHDMDAIRNLCHRVIWVEDGIIKSDGDPSEVLKEYMSTFATVAESGRDLTGITNRGGNGEVQYTGIELLAQSGHPLQAVHTGDSFVIRLHYHAKERIRSPNFAVDLHTQYGTKVTSFNTYVSGFDVPFLDPGDGYLDLKIAAFNVSSGRYFVSLWLASPGNLWYDRLDQCTVLNVEPTDFYNAGRGINPQHKHLYGVVFFPCEWELNGKVF
jgi:homopolymeric O-antigen transport system ATP-binding protein